MGKKKDEADKILRNLWKADEVRQAGSDSAADVIENAARADARDFGKIPDDES